jgi:hypothetical protein
LPERFSFSGTIKSLAPSALMLYELLQSPLRLRFFHPKGFNEKFARQIITYILCKGKSRTRKLSKYTGYTEFCEYLLCNMEREGRIAPYIQIEIDISRRFWEWIRTLTKNEILATQG